MRKSTLLIAIVLTSIFWSCEEVPEVDVSDSCKLTSRLRGTTRTLHEDNGHVHNDSALTLYEYDEAGLVKTIINQQWFGSGEFVETGRQEIETGNDGRISRSNYTYADGLNNQTQTYSYWPDSIHIIAADGQEQALSTVKMTFDDTQHLVKNVLLSKSNQKSLVTTYQWTGSNINRKDLEYYDDNEVLIASSTVEYTHSNQPNTNQVNFYPGYRTFSEYQIISATTTVFDENGTMISKEIQTESSLIYDDQGKLMESQWYIEKRDAEGTLLSERNSSFQWSYDCN
ncbi:MAG: hypothetical protein KI790_07035 [Cyclobacteriaceae bacterium]|nr:hypothetical protein [Cyclobacteriaceae bacterium HetDA_MAG_MS6]